MKSKFVIIAKHDIIVDAALERVWIVWIAHLMKIFVAYSFRDAWIKRYVFDFLRAYGIEVESGDELEGQKIDDGVKDKINLCEGMIAFTTRRDKIEGREAWKTSDWVVQEIDHADSINCLKEGY